MIRISEIFCSIQGEGQWLGTPSVFVRLSGCNLRCIWCDTPYASWEPEGPIVSVKEVLEQVLNHKVDHVVVTGGEPMIFADVVELTSALRDSGKKITIETAGTADLPVECDLISISPKLANSIPLGTPHEKMHEQRRWAPDVIRSLIARYPYQLKFVVSGDSIQADIIEIEGMLTEIGSAEPSRVFLMAEGRDAAGLSTVESELVNFAIERGWRLTPRYQIHLFGDTRGT